MILCCGEALIDMLPRTTGDGHACFQPFAGGAVFNTSIALSRLGVETGLFTGLSNDLFGGLLATELDRSGVSTDLAHRSDNPTTLAFVELTGGHARYAFYDENTAGRLLAQDDLPIVPDHVSAMFFGGISLAVTPCADTYRALMEREAPSRVTMIDPNVRPGFIRDEAAYRDRLDAMLRVADIVKLSDEDLHWLMGAGDTVEQATKLRAMGPKLVCITEGAKGAWAVTADHAVFVDATPVTPVDTVGAGDTFNAGVLAALHDAGLLTRAALGTLSEDALRGALSLATRAAAVTVSRAGANPPTRADLA
ncbi:carbohydrate kinase [Meridianimarinicoccus roseus]|uniref:Carbohydrate kinase n=1 Tax=Meridianimarinicoccus roseus TaxID=2072018 RepID=A0A2V2LA61_9RHOB|nr:carbohydrate kinase [Meridianimarinicoccus roseus]PWR02298.1 carbohydrate kinase [Meridianimarinicoccus roseus]